MAIQERNVQPGQVKMKSRPLVASLILFAGLGTLAFALGASISLGAAEIDLRTVWEGVFRFNPELTSHQIIQELRMPRALAAALVGAFLAVSGSIMQGMTSNPLASPSIMGVTAGSAFMIAVAFAFYPGTSHLGLMIWSFVGAGLGASLVFTIGAFSKGGLTPVKASACRYGRGGVVKLDFFSGCHSF